MKVNEIALTYQLLIYTCIVHCLNSSNVLFLQQASQESTIVWEYVSE